MATFHRVTSMAWAASAAVPPASAAAVCSREEEQILPCLDKPRHIVFSDATPEMLATLEGELDRMNGRIACLTQNRDAIASYLEEVRARAREAAA